MKLKSETFTEVQDSEGLAEIIDIMRNKLSHIKFFEVTLDSLNYIRVVKLFGGIGLVDTYTPCQTEVVIDKSTDQYLSIRLKRAE